MVIHLIIYCLGIEKAEQNILPVINNLLENREMSLEDGRMLISSQRYNELLVDYTEEQLSKMKIFKVHPNFRVIAIGLPIPPFQGTPLDPPLRSRFQSRNIKVPTADQVYSMIVNDEHYNSLPRQVIRDLVTFAFAVSTATNPLSSGTITPPFPMSDIMDVFDQMVMQQEYMTADILKNIITSIYPFDIYYKCMEGTDNSSQVIEKVLNQTVAKCMEQLAPQKQQVHKPLWEKKLESSFVPIPYQMNVLQSMVQSYVLGKDICVVGAKGSGKSQLVKQFGRVLDIQSIEYFPLHKEMTSRDLLQRRVTDDKGDTKWKDSPLIEAIKHGRLCVLDGIDRMSPDILLSLQPLIHDRMLFLFDGSRYIGHNQYTTLLQHVSKEELTKRKIYPIHPDFRIVSIGQTPHVNNKWFTVEVMALFHFYFLDTLSIADETKILKSKVANVHDSSIDTLIAELLQFKSEFNAKEDNQRKLSLRDLGRIVVRYAHFKNHEVLIDNMLRAVMYYAMPKMQRESVDALLSKFSFAKHVTPVEPIDSIKMDKNSLNIGSLSHPISQPLNPALVPKPYFVDNKEHTRVIKELLKDHKLNHHSLLIGGQGVGKNKVCPNT